MGFRTVDIRIEGSYVGQVAWYIPLGLIGGIIADWGMTAQGIKALLEANNWVIDRIADESGWTGNYIYRITATVGDGYSDGVIQDQVVRDLAGFFTVAGASIVSDPYQVPSIYTGSPANYGSGPANYGSTPGATPPNAPGADPGSGDFLANLGLGAGISTPVALLGAAILLVVVLKR